MSYELKMGDEEGRLHALDRLNVLDTAEEAPFEKVVTLIQQILSVPMCAVSLVDRSRQWFKARRGINDCETARDISFCTHTIQYATPFIVRDSLQDPLFAENPLVIGDPFIRSYAGIPLKTPDGYNVGSLCAIDTKPREFSAHEIAVLDNFAKIVVDELELRQIAATDYLTGALSRRAWMEKAKSETLRARRYGRPLALAILDLDKFKSINDTYGHPAGDTVIKTIAELCISLMRQSDSFGRLGGEEFGLLMPETTIDNAVTMVERIRTLFASTPIDLGEPVHSTISIGIAELGDEELETLYQRADKALYEAKTGGRNRSIALGSDKITSSRDVAQLA